MRRSLIVASCARPMASSVGGQRHRRAVEVAAGDDLAGVGEHHRVVGRGVRFDLDDAADEGERSRAAPCTCGAQRIE